MYPYQRTPMGNPYTSPIYPYIVGVYGLLSPRIPIFSPYKYHGYTYVRGTPNCPLSYGAHLVGLGFLGPNPHVLGIQVVSSLPLMAACAICMCCMLLMAMGDVKNIFTWCGDH